VEEYGFAGMKPNGAQNHFPVNDPGLAVPVIDAIAEMGAMLAFHCGADDYVNTHPWRIAEAAKRHPGTKILVVHMGGAGTPSLHDEAIRFANECPNEYLVGSAIGPESIARAVRGLGPSRVLFGSDTPFAPLRAEIAKYRAILEGAFSEADRARVMGTIAAALFTRR
jgi:hypothetical protein